MIEIYVSKKDGAILCKSYGGDYHPMMLTGGSVEVDEKDLVKTGEFEPVIRDKE